MLIRLAEGLAARLRCDRGATAVEYGLMVALIALIIIAAVLALGQSVGEIFSGFLDAMDWA